MTIDEIKDMLPQKQERVESVEEPKKSQLVQASYDVVGCILEVYKQLSSWNAKLSLNYPNGSIIKLLAIYVRLNFPSPFS